jgi:CDGSH-type Zn-finger protein
MVTIRLRENGPIVIEGDEATVIDWHGVPYPIARRPIALCRCGGSAKKPFCDGTHKQNGFCGAEAASSAPTNLAPTSPALVSPPAISPPAQDDHEQR